MKTRGTSSAARRGVKLGALLAAAAAVSAAPAVAGARAPDGSEVLRGSGDLSGVSLNCPTDTVTLSGAYHYTENGSVSRLGSGTWFSRGAFSFDLSGVSGTGATGVSYQVVGATDIDYSFFFGGTSGGAAVEHSTETWRLVPSGGGAPFSIQQTFVLVAAPDGTTTLVDQGSGDCS